MKASRERRLDPRAGALALLCVLGCLAQAAAAAAEPSAWDAYGGHGGGGGQYSPLSGITVDNVDELELAWTYRTGEVSSGGEVAPTTFEVNPLHVNESLYLCTPFGRVVALEPDTGRERWSFDPRVSRASTVIVAHICRGVSYWEDEEAPEGAACRKRIFQGVADGRLLALDADSGRPCPDFGEGGQVDLNAFDYGGEGRVGLSSPPAIVADRVIVGANFPSYGRSDSVDGIVRAFDARTGRRLWAWNPIPEAMRDRTGGVNVWAPMSVDRQRGLVFLPTTTPTPDIYGAARKQPIPYADAVVALRAGSGEPLWHFQTVHHDLFDYDLPAQPLLAEITRQGERIPVVIQITKTGFVFVLHRDTGEPVFPVEERPVPPSDVPGERAAPTQPFPAALAPFARQSLTAEQAWGLTFWDRGRCRERLAALRNEGPFTPPSTRGSVIIPGSSGGGNWGGAAFDPDRHLLVVNNSNIAFSTRLIERGTFDPGAPRSPHGEKGEMPDTPYVYVSEPLMSPFGVPCTPPPWGALTAYDLDAGRIAWQVPFGRMTVEPLRTPRAWGAPNMGGPIVTGGGLVFIGASLDSRLRAYELASGRQVWDAELPAPGIATPMTYTAGTPARQFVVIAAGGHARLDPKLSDALVAFALPVGRSR